MNRQILDIVRPKGITGYIQFKTYLRTSRQEYLADHLESTETQLIGTTIKDENNAQTVTKNTGNISLHYFILFTDEMKNTL
jgi:hypothetical protein